MSAATIEPLGSLEKFEDILAFLKEVKKPKRRIPVSDWDNNWDPFDEEEDEGSLSSSKEDEGKPKNGEKTKLSAVQKWIMSHSSAGDMMVVANGRKAIFFKGFWNERSSQMGYLPSFRGEVAENEDERVTAACCVPLVSSKKTSPGTPDWTCIILGFSSGAVRMYTEDGKPLVNQVFHAEKVTSIKCQSYNPACSSVTHDQLEEIFVIYETTIVILEGFGLFQTLRACRNHLARLQASSVNAAVDAPPLTFKKWQHDRGIHSNDSENIGVSTPNTFDHLHTASLLGGYRARITNVPATSMIFVNTGKKPFVSYEYAQEGHAVPVLTEIAFAVASKLKSSIVNAATGWLSWGGVVAKPEKPEKDQPAKEPAVPMSMRCGLNDFRRTGERVYVSPCKRLTAVTDMLGRVSLVDNALGIVVRMWKGYRDAQCAWIQVTENLVKASRKESRSPKEALFLAIYGPRLGLVEVFAMQQGPKVASFNVSRKGRLMTASYGMMGLNNIPLKSGNKPAMPCIFVDEAGKVTTLNLPFHLSLCDKTNTKMKDMHLLKTLQKTLKSVDEVGAKVVKQEIFDTLKDVKMPTMINQGFKILAHRCKDVSLFRDIVQSYLDHFCDEGDRDLTLVFKLQNIVELYEFLQKTLEEPPEYQKPKAGASSGTLLDLLHASEDELKALETIAKHQKQITKTSRIRFEDDKGIPAFNDFLSSFKIEFDSTKAKASSGRLEVNDKQEYESSFGALLFGGVMNNPTHLSDWKSRIQTCSLVPSQIMSLAFQYWCENNKLSNNYEAMMKKLYDVLRAVSELDPKSVSLEFSRSNSWWEQVRQTIAKSAEIYHIYSFSIVCRAVATDLQDEAEKRAKEIGVDKMEIEPQEKSEKTVEETPPEETEPIVEDEDWENMSLELMRWNLLLKQIEDLSLLSNVLGQRVQLDDPLLPVLPLSTGELSVASLLDKGKGCISELVGKWLTTIAVNPVEITDEALSGTQKVIEAPPSPELRGQDRKRQKLAEGKHAPVKSGKKEEAIPVPMEPAPVEVDTGVEPSKDFNAVSRIQDLVRQLIDNFSVSLSPSVILANYSWEYCLEWNKDTNAVEYLDAGVKCAVAIPNPHIKQGMLLMMWTTFMNKKLAACTRATVTQEKLVEKLTGFGSVELEESFLKIMVVFFENLLEVNVACEGTGEGGEERPQPRRRKRRNYWIQDASSASLTDLATKQRNANYEMLLLHYQLSIVSYFACRFKVKRHSMKPVLLFDTKSRMMLFNDLSTPFPYSHAEVDLALKKLREEFIRVVVTSSIYEIPEEPTDSDEVVPQSEAVEDSSRWVDLAIDLGHMWNLEVDRLRVHQICEFYSCGFDRLGRETIRMVNAREVLGSKLLVVAGMRVNAMLQTMDTQTVTEILSAFSTNLSNWLQNLDYSELRCQRFPKSSVPELAHEVLQLIPESSYDYQLAEELANASSVFV